MCKIIFLIDQSHVYEQCANFVSGGILRFISVIRNDRRKINMFCLMTLR